MGAHSIGTDFTHGNVTKLLLRFLTPFLLSSILNSLYNTIDMIIIGQVVGSVGTVAVSQGGKMLKLLTLVGSGLSTGGQVVIAQQIGAGHRDQIKRTIGTLFCLLGIVSVTAGAVCFIFAPSILGLLNTPPESFHAAMMYFRITCLGLPLQFVYNAVSSILRGMGDSKSPLLFVSISVVVNMILNLIFVAGLKIGAPGSAMATVIAIGVSVLFSMSRLYRMREECGFDFDRASFRIDRDIARVLMQIGAPLAARSAVISFTQLYIISHVNALGLTQAAAYGIGDKIFHLSNIVTQSTNQAGAAMVAQNIGAGRYKRARRVVRSALTVTLCMATLLSVPSILFHRQLFSLFTGDADVVAYSASFMLISALAYYLAAISGSLGSVVTGSGNSTLAFIAGLLDGVVFRIAFSFLFGHTFGMGVVGFFLGNSLARLGLIFVNLPYYLSGGWTRRTIFLGVADD